MAEPEYIMPLEELDAAIEEAHKTISAERPREIAPTGHPDDEPRGEDVKIVEGP